MGGRWCTGSRAGAGPARVGAEASGQRAAAVGAGAPLGGVRDSGVRRRAPYDVGPALPVAADLDRRSRLRRGCGSGVVQVRLRVVAITHAVPGSRDSVLGAAAALLVHVEVAVGLVPRGRVAPREGDPAWSTRTRRTGRRSGVRRVGGHGRSCRGSCGLVDAGDGAVEGDVRDPAPSGGPTAGSAARSAGPGGVLVGGDPAGRRVDDGVAVPVVAVGHVGHRRVGPAAGSRRGLDGAVDGGGVEGGGVDRVVERRSGVALLAQFGGAVGAEVAGGGGDVLDVAVVDAGEEREDLVVGGVDPDVHLAGGLFDHLGGVDAVPGGGLGGVQRDRLVQVDVASLAVGEQPDRVVLGQVGAGGRGDGGAAPGAVAGVPRRRPSCRGLPGATGPGRTGRW